MFDLLLSLGGNERPADMGGLSSLSDGAFRLATARNLKAYQNM